MGFQVARTDNTMRTAGTILLLLGMALIMAALTAMLFPGGPLPQAAAGWLATSSLFVVASGVLLVILGRRR